MESYNRVFWFLCSLRLFLSCHGMKFYPIATIVIWDNIILNFNYSNKKYFLTLIISFHSEVLVFIKSGLLLNSKNFSTILLYNTLCPCFFCCSFLYKYNIKVIYYLTVKRIFCFFFNILYFFLKKNVIIFFIENKGLSFLNFSLFCLFFLLRRF